MKAGTIGKVAPIRTEALIEIFPWESGKRYRTQEAIRIEWAGKTLTVPAGFAHDQYTFAPNLPDARPSICHDFACDMKEWDDGTPLPRWMANLMFRDLMLASPDVWTRRMAGLYFRGVELYRIVKRIP
jgi:hypothetical protein